jgi:pimeloyl-ACP methyl ester carboxylesterase
MDVILILQGGGSLGAYECGVYRTLAPWMQTNGHNLLVVGGTSIGAINATVIAARHGDADHGVAALTGLWHSLSEGSALFLPPLGSLWSNTPIREVLNALQKPESPGPQPLSDCHVFLVELFAPPKTDPGPIMGNWDVWARRDQIIFQNKGEYDAKAAHAHNAHIDFVQEARRLLNSVASSQQAGVKELAEHVDEALRTLRSERRFRLNIQRIVRSSDATQEVSREIDFSLQRIETLIKQGEDDARKVLMTSLSPCGADPARSPAST